MVDSVRSGLIICDATPVFESKSMRNDDLVPCACSFIQDGDLLHSVLSLSNFLFSVFPIRCIDCSSFDDRFNCDGK